MDEIAYINVLRSAFKQNTSVVDEDATPLKTAEALNLRSQLQKQGADIDIIKETNGKQNASLTELSDEVKALKKKDKKNKKDEESQKSEEDTSSPPNERVNLEKLQQSITANNRLCFDGSGLKRFKSKLGDGLDLSNGQEEFLKKGENTKDICVTYKAYQRPDFDDGFYNEENQRRLLEMQTYLAAGFGLTDLYCNRFFTTATAATQNRQFAQDLNTGVDTLVGAVLSLSGAGGTAQGITNSGFGLIGDGIQAFDAAYLVAPDLGAVRELLDAAQDQYRKPFFVGTPEQMKEYFPHSYPAARAIIQRYASQCSFTGMRQLISTTVSDRAERIRRNLEFERPARVMGDKNPNNGDGNGDAADAMPQGPMPAANPPVTASPNTNAQPPSADTETRILSVPIG
ncbi:hypothetical protein ACR9YC_09505 [Parasphingorhabdus sp. DH2-15]|uniref:hypothetical protein n=1 Tax=Parasphingorhabdus sp. DH2-15 TaxID=3444112 RepID=UPI003F6839FF